MHIWSGLRGSALALPTHAFAWHGVEGAHSSSLLHASLDGSGAQSEHPQSFASPNGEAPASLPGAGASTVAVGAVGGGAAVEASQAAANTAHKSSERRISGAVYSGGHDGR